MGFLSDYRAYSQQLTDAPVVFHEFIALATAGAALGNRWKLPGFGGWIYPNLWVLILAKSGMMHKSTAVSISRRLARQTHGAIPQLPWNGTPEGLTPRLAEMPYGIMYCDEIAAWVGLMNRQHMQGVLAFWTSLYDGYVDGTAYKHSPKSAPLEDLAVSVVAASTMRWLTDSLKEGGIEGGFLPRFLLIPAYTQERIMSRPPTAWGDERPRELAHQLERLSNSSGTMDWSEGAKHVYDRWHGELTRQSMDGGRADNWPPRFAVTCIKLAMIVQVDRDQHRVISEKSMVEAVQYMRWAAKELSRLMSDELAFTWIEQQVQKCKALLSRPSADEGWHVHTWLLPRMHLSVRQMDDVTRTMVQSGLIEIREQKKIRGPSQRQYRLVTRDPGEEG